MPLVGGFHCMSTVAAWPTRIVPSVWLNSVSARKQSVSVHRMTTARTLSGYFGNPANLLFRGTFSSHPAPARLSPENKSRGFPSLGHPRFGVSVQGRLMAQKKSRTSAYNFTCDGWVKTGDWLSVRAVGFAPLISEKPRRVQGGMVYGSITSCWPGVGLIP